MTSEALKYDLLDYGLEDILGLWWVIGVVAKHIGSDPRNTEQLIEPTCEVVRDLLEFGYVIAGDVKQNENGILYIRSWELNPEDASPALRKSGGNSTRHRT